MKVKETEHYVPVNMC